jgi:predicted acyl esterase
LFLTQGFLENNTKQDGAFDYFNSLAGTGNRAWFGQFDHCRAWETQQKCGSAAGTGDNTRLAVGHAGFVDEVMRFLDEHLKGIAPEIADPKVEVQDSMGRWRAEEQWPPTDVQLLSTDLRPGTYTDNGTGSGSRPTAAQGVWTISAPLEHDAWIAGTPRLTVSVDAVPNANLAANVYDIDPNGKVTMISRGVQSLTGVGVRNVTLSLYGQDWPLAAGHRIGVLIGSADTDQFQYSGTATRQAVTVRNASITLPFLTYNRTEFLEGGPTGRLEQFLTGSTSVLAPGDIAAAESAFNLPAPLVDRVPAGV